MDRAACCYPELHFNRSTLFQYEEMFGSALAGYSRAAELDPGWTEPPDREKQLLEYLEKVTELLQNKVYHHHCGIHMFWRFLTTRWQQSAARALVFAP